MLYKLLREEGKPTGCEMETGGGVADIVDLHTGYAYEVESKPSMKRWKDKTKNLNVTDVLIIDLNKTPDDIAGMEEYLRSRIV